MQTATFKPTGLPKDSYTCTVPAAIDLSSRMTDAEQHFRYEDQAILGAAADTLKTMAEGLSLQVFDLIRNATPAQRAEAKAANSQLLPGSDEKQQLEKDKSVQNFREQFAESLASTFSPETALRASLQKLIPPGCTPQKP